MSKPYFYRIDAMDFFATVNSFQSEKELVKFVKQFAVDLITRKAKTPYSEKVISEAIEYINKKKRAGSKGGKQKASSAKAVLEQCYDFANSKTVANSSSSTIDNIIGEQVPAKKKDASFLPPSPLEVQAYMSEIGFNGNGELFCDYYQAKGWMIGKNKMKDWKAAVRTWSKNEYGNKKEETRNESSEGGHPSWY